MRQTIKHGATLDIATPDEIKELLKQGRGDAFGGIFDVIAGDFPGPEPVLMVNPPYKRLRVTRQGNGTDALAVPAAGNAPVQVLPATEGRLGGQIVNRGAGSCFLYLSEPADLSGSEFHARGTLWLSAAGGSWDMEISSLIWGGSIWALGDSAATTLTVVEL